MDCKQWVIEHQEPWDDEPTQQRTPVARNHQIGLSAQIVLSDPHIGDCVWIDHLAKQPYRVYCKDYLYNKSSSYKACPPGKPQRLSRPSPVSTHLRDASPVPESRG